MIYLSHQAREQATQQKNKRSEPGTDYNTIGKITDVRVVRYDILVSSRTKQATQQSITQRDEQSTFHKNIACRGKATPFRYCWSYAKNQKAAP